MDANVGLVEGTMRIRDQDFARFARFAADSNHIVYQTKLASALPPVNSK
jgi:hypothetical protein